MQGTSRGPGVTDVIYPGLGMSGSVKTTVGSVRRPDMKPPPPGRVVVVVDLVAVDVVVVVGGRVVVVVVDDDVVVGGRVVVVVVDDDVVVGGRVVVVVVDDDVVVGGRVVVVVVGGGVSALRGPPAIAHAPLVAAVVAPLMVPPWAGIVAGRLQALPPGRVVVVVGAASPGGVTVRLKVPCAPAYPSTTMKYVCPAVTVGVMREARNRPVALGQVSSLHPAATSGPPEHTPLRR